MTHSHTFYQILGKIVVADFEKIGEIPQKFPVEYLENDLS